MFSLIKTRPILIETRAVDSHSTRNDPDWAQFSLRSLFLAGKSKNPMVFFQLEGSKGLRLGRLSDEEDNWGLPKVKQAAGRRESLRQK